MNKCDKENLKNQMIQQVNNTAHYQRPLTSTAPRDKNQIEN